MRFPLAVCPLAELLIVLQAERFTGCIGLRPGGQTPPPEFSRTKRGRAGLARGSDLVFFREGGAVGLERVGPSGATQLAQILFEHGAFDRAEMDAFAEGLPDALALARELESRRLVKRSELDRAVAEHARRRLFARAGDASAMVDLQCGIDALAHFYPVHIDLRPAIAFGLVVHGHAADKRAQMTRVRGRFARLVAPYHAERNAHALPPPVLRALKRLAEGVLFDPEQPKLPGL
ncbi:MAG: hypothetical protein AAFU79_30305, partial [Myxococcota bacterium]